jgi:acyl carrier protein
MFQDRLTLRAQIRDVLSEFIGTPPDQIDETRDFAEYGLGSAEAALFIGALEDLVGSELPPLLVYDHPTVEALADAIVGQSAVLE